MKNYAKIMIIFMYKCLKKIKKILKSDPGEKSLKVPFIVYADLECMFQKLGTCQNDPKKYFTEKKAEHMPSSYSCVMCC